MAVQDEPYPMRLDSIPCRIEGGFRVVVETPRGAPFKLKFDPDIAALVLKRPLPLGFVWPYDFGFVPSTKAPDGDPIDALVWWDAASAPGVVIACRPLGVLQLDQDDDGRRVRNDRIIAVPLRFDRGDIFRSVDDLPPRVRDELAHFSTSSVFFEEKDPRILGWSGPATAERLVRGAPARSRPQPNGRRSGAPRRASSRRRDDGDAP